MNQFSRLTTAQKLFIIILFIAIAGFAVTRLTAKKNSTPQYQTATAQKDTLIVSISGSGNVSSSNSTSVSTDASGVVKKIYVKDGDEVKVGDPIAEIELDLTSQQSAAQALSSYQSAKNSLETAKANLYSTNSDMFTKWNSYYNLATNGTYQNGDGSPNANNRTAPQFIIAQNDWLSTESRYKIQQSAVNQAQTALSSAWLTYQRSTPVIYAPISGKVSGLSLQIGSVITRQTSSTTIGGTKIANIVTDALPNIVISLTEIDVPKVKIGNKATVTFDAIPDKTFTGKIISIDTVGSVSSNVTTYPTVIQLDFQSPQILPNMGAAANIILQTKDNVLLVPNAAVQSANGSKFVRVMKNGTLSQVPVETGLSSDSQTEIISGITEGDTVVTGSTSTTPTRTGTQSVFGGFGGGNRQIIRMGR